MNKNADELLRLAEKLSEAVSDWSDDMPGRASSDFFAVVNELRAIASRPAAGPQDGVAGPDYVPGVLDATAPERIWLQVDTSALGDEREEAFPPADNFEHVTWSADSIGGLEVEYVRADLTTPRDQPAVVASAEGGDGRSTHLVRRGPAQGFSKYEEIPCDCAATMDHSIGREVLATPPKPASDGSVAAAHARAIDWLREKAGEFHTDQFDCEGPKADHALAYALEAAADALSQPQQSGEGMVPEAVQATNPAGGVIADGDWCINFGTHVRVTNAVFAKGWNACRAAMLAASAPVAKGDR